MLKFMKGKSGSQVHDQRQALLENEESSDHEMAHIQSSIQNADHDPQKDQDTNAKSSCCSWKCCCLCTTLTSTLFILISFLFVLLHVAPKFAQDTLDNASMDIVSGKIYNPTNSTITLNTTIMVSNAGMLNGELSAHTAAVTVNGTEIGTLPMPTLNTIANQNTFISMAAVLTITNKTQFQKTCKELLQNIDQTWHLSGRNVQLSVETGFMTKAFTVNVEKDLVLKAAKLYNFIASDLDVNSATSSIIESVSNLQFLSKSVFEFSLPNTLMNVYSDDVYIGYVPLEELNMKPGLNTIENQHLFIEKTDDNALKLNEFFSNYLHGFDQEVFMKGPIASEQKGYESIVIDGIFEQSVKSVGYQGGDLAFGALLTEATQLGWKVDGETLHGAYSNFLNPLSVPVRITNIEGIAIMPQVLKYHVSLIKWLVERDCEAKEFGQLRIGRGIYKDNHDQTWVDVEANGRATYFAIVDPPQGQFKGACLEKFTFDCCYATLTAAYACALNPGIQKTPSNGQLSSDYMPLSMEANVTLLVDHMFEVVVATSQPFLPLYFGKAVYAGYAQDLELNCKHFQFK